MPGYLSSSFGLQGLGRRQFGQSGRRKAEENWAELGSTIEQGEQGLTASGEPLLDEQGFSSTLPGRYAAPFVQYFSEKQNAARNANLMKGSQALMRSARETFSAYRPGGSASAAAGMFQGEAQAMAGRQTSAPDLMFRFNQHLFEREVGFKRRAQNLAILQSGLSLSQVEPGGGVGAAAHGAVVPPTPGGKQVTLGEGGEAEVVVPFSKLPGFAAEISSEATSAPVDSETTPSDMPGGPGIPLSQVQGALTSAGGDGQNNGDPGAQRIPAEEQRAAPSMMGDPLSRFGDDPGADGYGLPGAAHMASYRLGLPSDILHAMVRGTTAQEDPGAQTMGSSLHTRLDALLLEDAMMTIAFASVP